MMTTMKAMCSRALLAVMLLCATSASLATPMYRVALDTSAFSGSGYLDLTLAALDGAAPLTATLSNFTGDYSSPSFTQGQASGSVGSTVLLGNSATFNEFLQAVDFGGIFSFDVSFDVADAGTIGTRFGLALVNAALTDYLAGTTGEFISIELMPGVAPQVSVGVGFASVGDLPAPAELPEPGPAALLAVGLGLMLIQRRQMAR